MCRCRNVILKSMRISSKMKRRVAGRAVRKTEYSYDLPIYCLVTTTAVLSYLNSLHGEFVHDDIPAIVSNNDVTGLTPLRDVLVNDFWGTPMSDVNSHKSYRPLTTLTFRINHALVGLKPFWWHFFNVTLHAACCALVARACVTIARLQRPFAALAALLFAVHPVHTEAVAGIVGRADVLSCIFFLTSLLVYHESTSNNKWVWLSIVLGTLSMLSKETGITILFHNIVFDFYRCWPLVKRSLLLLKPVRTTTGFSVRSVKVILSLALLICLRLALLQGSLPSFAPQDNPAAFHPNFVVRLLTFCYLAALNWWLLLCPWSLSHDWQMGSVPLVTSGWDPRNLATCAAFGTLMFLCYRCIADIENQKQTPMVLGLLLLVIPFIPASNLFVTVGFVLAERILYISSVGSVIITAYGMQLMWYSRPGARVLLVISFLILAVSGIARTYKRNHDWKDRATLLRTDLLTVPQNAKLQYNFGNFLRESEQQDNAIKHYKEALRLWPTYASAYNNLGTLVTGMNSAEHHFLQAIKYNKFHANAHYNLGKLYKKNGKHEKAVQMFTKCVTLQPKFKQAYLELLTLKPESEKKMLLAKLVELEPGNWEHRILYGNWYRNQGLTTAALCQYLEATRLSFIKENVKNIRGDLLSVRLTALSYRSIGQTSRMLQLLTRWHTWKRGRPNPISVHIYLREWHLKMEMRKKERFYNEASNNLPARPSTCLDHTRFSIKSPLENINDNNIENKINKKTNDNSEVNKKSVPKLNCDVCKKKRTECVTSQIKTHNKSEIGLKDKKCRKKESNVNDNDVMKELSRQIILQAS